MPGFLGLQQQDPRERSREPLTLGPPAPPSPPLCGHPQLLPPSSWPPGLLRNSAPRPPAHSHPHPLAPCVGAAPPAWPRLPPTAKGEQEQNWQGVHAPARMGSPRAPCGPPRVAWPALPQSPSLGLRGLGPAPRCHSHGTLGRQEALTRGCASEPRPPPPAQALPLCESPGPAALPPPSLHAGCLPYAPDVHTPSAHPTPGVCCAAPIPESPTLEPPSPFSCTPPPPHPSSPPLRKVGLPHVRPTARIPESLRQVAVTVFIDDESRAPAEALTRRGQGEASGTQPAPSHPAQMKGGRALGGHLPRWLTLMHTRTETQGRLHNSNQCK
ncbi:hypothetical protein H8959_002593 [Pygathrix nigripes]